MAAIDTVFNAVDSVFAWLSTSLKQTTESYCDLQTADSPTVLVAHDGSLVTILNIRGVRGLVGAPEFQRIHQGLQQSLQATMSQHGHTIQVHFAYHKDAIGEEITNIFRPAIGTAKNLDLELEDLFGERIQYLSNYCAHEEVHLALWTRPSSMTSEQYKRSMKEKGKIIREKNLPAFQQTQNLIAAIPELRDAHDSFCRAIATDLHHLNINAKILEAHDAVYVMRRVADPEFTDRTWRASLPGDKITIRKPQKSTENVADLLWPSLARQILPRDAVNLDLRTVRIGDRIYSSVFIDLFPKEIQKFITLFQRTLQTHIPWRISFLIDSEGYTGLRVKRLLSAILSFTSAQNRLIADSINLLNYIRLNTDDAVVKLRVAAATWAPEGERGLLRSRASMLAKAIESWGSCDVSEVSGDAFEGVVSSMLGVSANSVATKSVAPLSDVLYMLPVTRPSSPWEQGAILFRSPDGKPWPYQPGSPMQTTWIDLMYARPGSGKSVLSNAINLALCLSGGLQRLPRIAIVDIGPSSSGLISLLKEALPYNRRHLVAYHRLRMRPEYAINPFDTQLGCRYPGPQERTFLVNFMTLLATPVGEEKAYDGIPDMSGLIVNELYKYYADDGNPHTYTPNVELLVDGILDEIGFIRDPHTTWWEVTDALFIAGFEHEAMLAQRHAMPLLSDAVSICRSEAIEDLYGKIVAPTGEPLIHAFTRMISAAVREYSILAQVTQFDLGEARVVSLDLDEVAKSGGEAADRQTAVMYMLARYVLARHYYLTDDMLSDVAEAYHPYHQARISEIREDPKRLVFDEFHRTSRAKAVRDQVIVDMREGRKWKVQIALISQSLDDFDEVMVEFATSIFVMEAGPEQAIKKTARVFGLSETGQVALRTRVHGPRAGGGTFLAQFATKEGINTHLLTLTLGPIELWAFSTTAEDVNIRNRLYQKLGPAETRRVLGNLFPGGTATKALEERLAAYREERGLIVEESKLGVIDELVEDILDAYNKDPNIKRL